MKLLVITLILSLSVPAFAETWKDKEIREAQERQIRLQQQNPNYYNQQQQRSSSNDRGACMGDCGAEHGVCVSYCGSNNSCSARCSNAHGRCIARCR